MAAFRLVGSAQAGPGALGILVPPGPRTLMILRPRNLAWDLLPLRPGAPGPGLSFHELDRDSAARQARELYRALEARGDGPELVQAVAVLPAGFVVQVLVGAVVLVACRRIPGQPYQPAVFATAAEAEQAAEAVAASLAPSRDGTREVYFNTQRFAR